MITINHNFDETKFMWLWARYVKSGNIEKHCVNSIPGQYSKKFSGSSNHDLLSQPILVMDEVPDGQYEAIYFCGVLKAGYLDGSGLIVPPKTVSNVPPVTETNVPPLQDLILGTKAGILCKYLCQYSSFF